MNDVRVIGMAHYLPGEAIPFENISQVLGPLERADDKLNKWIQRIEPLMKQMLGVNRVHYAFDPKTRQMTDDNRTMSVKAARAALQEAGLAPEEVELLVYGGNYSEQMPALSTLIQEDLGIDQCGEFHVHANCTSTYKAIKIGYELIRSGEYRNALVVSSCLASAFFRPEFYHQELMSKDDVFLRWYLCDGAAAFVLEAADETQDGWFLSDCYIESVGGFKKSAMGNQLPAYWNNPQDNYRTGAHHIRQVYLTQMGDVAHTEENGRTVFTNGLERMLAKKNLDRSAIKTIVVNMPSKAVVDLIAEECLALGFEREDFYSSVDQVGYPGPPAAMISMEKCLRSHDFAPGDKVLSFVMEVSKFMQAGFVLTLRAKGAPDA